MNLSLFFPSNIISQAKVFLQYAKSANQKRKVDQLENIKIKNLQMT